MMNQSRFDDSVCGHQGSCFKPAVFALVARNSRREISVCAAHMDDYPEWDFEIAAVFPARSPIGYETGQGGLRLAPIEPRAILGRFGLFQGVGASFKMGIRRFLPGFMDALGG